MSKRIIPAVEVKYCDRCKGECFDHGESAIKVFKFWPDYGSPNYHADLDLCSACTTDLWVFVFGANAEMLGDRECDKRKESK